MLDGCATHTMIQEKILPWLKTKLIRKSALIIENIHGEEEYSVSLMEVELSHNVKINAYAIKQEFSFMEPNKKLIQYLWPNLDSHILEEILHNAYEGETHLIIGQDNYWALMDNSVGLENLIAHNNMQLGIIRTKFSSAMWSDEDVGEETLNHVPLGRFGESKDIAGVTAFLCSDDSAYITGETIVAAGGMNSHL